jgi:Na+-transporting methylmalonyl-CoA/oxaloacetate decarboxylase gamma subunit
MKLFLSILLLNAVMMSAVYVFASNEKEKEAAKSNHSYQKRNFNSQDTVLLSSK